MSDIITIGVTGLSFHHVAGSLVASVLRGMGFEVERLYAPHHENFTRLKSGETDLLASAWLPSSPGIYKSEVEEVGATQTVPATTPATHPKLVGTVFHTVPRGGGRSGPEHSLIVVAIARCVTP